MTRKSLPADEPKALQIVFQDVIPVEQAQPGDLVLFHNRVGKFCGTRIGMVVRRKPLPPDILEVRLKRPDGRLEQPQIISHRDVVRAYKEVSMEDPKDEEL